MYSETIPSCYDTSFLDVLNALSKNSRKVHHLLLLSIRLCIRILAATELVDRYFQDRVPEWYGLEAEENVSSAGGKYVIVGMIYHFGMMTFVVYYSFLSRRSSVKTLSFI